MGSSKVPRLRAVFQSAAFSHDCSLQPLISHESAGAISGMTEKGALALEWLLWCGPSSRRRQLAPDSLVGVWKSAREVVRGWRTMVGCPRTLSNRGAGFSGHTPWLLAFPSAYFPPVATLLSCEGARRRAGLPTWALTQSVRFQW